MQATAFDEPFIAQRMNKCVRCTHRIKPGQKVKRVRRSGTINDWPRVVHYDCSEIFLNEE